MTDLKMSEGLEEDGIVVGNTYDKYGSTNPIVKRMMSGFENALDDLLDLAGDGNIHEVGCGEGRWCIELAQRNRTIRGSDFSEQVVELAIQNAAEVGVDANLFSQKSIYDLDPDVDAADIIVCCEVLEHLEDPQAGLAALAAVTKKHLICSVPREPLWRTLNLARAKYISSLGNTPGHLQHWSQAGFKKFVSQHFDIIEMRSPVPWTMLLCCPRT